MKTFVDADWIAGRLGFVTTAAFLRARARLERDNAFPTALPTCLRPMKWRADQVLAWLDQQGLPSQQQITPATLAGYGPNVVLMSEARR
jgi:hypothetical protein